MNHSSLPSSEFANFTKQQTHPGSNFSVPCLPARAVFPSWPPGSSGWYSAQEASEGDGPKVRAHLSVARDNSGQFGAVGPVKRLLEAGEEIKGLASSEIV